MRKKKQQQQEVPMTAVIEKEEQLNSIQSELDLANSELNRVKKEIEEAKQQIEINSRREISKEEQRIVDKQVTNINQRESKNQVIEDQKRIDNQMVTGKFINRRVSGQPAKLTYMKYVDDPVKWYTFDDGGVYKIPRGFADQINEYYHIPKFKEKQGPQAFSDRVGDNSAIAEVDRSNKKYAFVPVGFS
jgi:hypothetical protein